LADGFHELRILAFEAGPIASQGRRIVPIRTSNHGRKITLSHDRKVISGAPFMLSVSAPGSIAIVVMMNSRLLVTIPGDKGSIKINLKRLGAGPLTLRVIGMGNGGPESNVIATPVNISG
jgi:hypothetical protein